MNRRAFVAGLGAVVAAPLAADAQQAEKVYRLGILSPAAVPDPSVATTPNLVPRALRELGYVEGKNLIIERRSLLKTRGSRMSAGLRTDPLLVGHGQMAWDRPWDIEVRRSHAPRVSAGEPGAAAATCGVEGAPATPTTDRDGSNLLGSAVEAVDELAAFAASRPVANRGWLAPARVSTLLGVEESATVRSARDQCGPPRLDSANELRQSSLGCAKDPR
jgi:hypothetical protein